MNENEVEKSFGVSSVKLSKAFVIKYSEYKEYVQYSIISCAQVTQNILIISTLGV